MLMLRGLRLLNHGPSMTPRVSFRALPVPVSGSVRHMLVHGQLQPQAKRLFSLSTPTAGAGEKPLPPRLKLNDADLTISYLKGTGPGGQKINKTNSAVQIIHHPTGLVVKSQATRSQSQNEKIARRLLADRIEERQNGGESRLAIKAERAKKKKASKVKKSKRKYRELDQEKNQSDEHEEEDQDGDQDGDQGLKESTDQQLPSR